MVVQNAYNHKTVEYNKYDDVLENNILPNKLNATAIEKFLIRVNVGSKRRIRNNHADRLASFKNK